MGSHFARDRSHPAHVVQDQQYMMHAGTSGNIQFNVQSNTLYAAAVAARIIEERSVVGGSCHFRIHAVTCAHDEPTLQQNAIFL